MKQRILQEALPAFQLHQPFFSLPVCFFSADPRPPAAESGHTNSVQCKGNGKERAERERNGEERNEQKVWNHLQDAPFIIILSKLRHHWE
ncbi:hypothetical protein FKM82_025782 [Ascaphus truei]